MTSWDVDTLYSAGDRLKEGGATPMHTACKALAEWPNLEDVNLSDTAVGNLGLKRISKLTGLRRVNLSYSNVSDDGVMYLENATSIRSLSLDTRMVTDEGLGYLAKLKDMEELAGNFVRHSEHLLGCQNIG